MTDAVTVTAVYKDGMLRPVQPLGLRENQRVRIQIVRDEAENEAETAIRKLIEAGLLTPPQGQSDVPEKSEEQRQALADRLGRVPGKPLSEIIVEDRGEL
jgi:predicted DNA-binding antitoxin AbrB/MazE fold protein